MKATINGIAVEGTPEEVWAILQKSNAQGTTLKPVIPMPSAIDYDWAKGLPYITSGEITKRCSSPCFCSGACMGQVTTSKIADYSITTESIKKFM